MQECMDGMLLFYRNYRDLLSQALTWEQNGEYSRAIELLLQLTTQNCDDHDVLQQSWEKARIANFTVFSIQFLLVCNSTQNYVFLSRRLLT